MMKNDEKDMSWRHRMALETMDKGAYGLIEEECAWLILKNGHKIRVKKGVIPFLLSFRYVYKHNGCYFITEKGRKAVNATI